MVSVCAHVCHLDCYGVLLLGLFVLGRLVVVREVAVEVAVELHAGCEVVGEDHHEEEADRHSCDQAGDRVNLGEFAVAVCIHEEVERACDEGTWGAGDKLIIGFKERGKN